MAQAAAALHPLLPRTNFQPEDREPHGGDAKLHGGGVKGLTSLLILQRIMRTLKIQGKLASEPRPCDVFDMICGTSTGGLIAIMLGRLGMSTDTCIAEYKKSGKIIFGKGTSGGKTGKLIASVKEKSWYSIKNLEEAVKSTVLTAGGSVSEEFQEHDPVCRTFVCVTRVKTAAPEIIRNYATTAPDQEDVECLTWEAGCATAAAPFYFDNFTLAKNGETFTDGGLNRNNPVREALAECHRVWPNRNVGCLLSIGTGWAETGEIAKRPDKFLVKCLDMLTNSERIAADFESERACKDLIKANAYFRFNVQQGMADIQLNDYEQEERMKALTSSYLSRCDGSLRGCATSLLDPGNEYSHQLMGDQDALPIGLCQQYRPRTEQVSWLRDLYTSTTRHPTRAAIWGLGGTGKTQIAIDFATSMFYQALVLWVRADTVQHFIADYEQIGERLHPVNNDESASLAVGSDGAKVIYTKTTIERSKEPIILIIDNADSVEMFCEPTVDGTDLGSALPNRAFISFTTRDARFLGSVVPISNGLNLKPMEADEAMDLLIHSLPPDMGRQEDDSFHGSANWLLGEMGYLPLAIAQAAATMRECRMSMSEFTTAFKDVNTRAEILKRPIRELRGYARSVLVTWEVTYAQIKLSSDVAATLLMSLGCFHWSRIPLALLKSHVCLSNLSTLQVAQAIGTLVNFSVAEKSDSEDFPAELHVHPIVHFWIQQRWSADEKEEYLRETLRLLLAVINITHPQNRVLNAYLLPHAMETLDLCDSSHLETPAVARLFQMAASFLSATGYNASALAMIERAVCLSFVVWPEGAASRYLIQKFKGDVLLEGARYQQAIIAFQAALRMILETTDDGIINKDDAKIEILLNLLSAHQYTSRDHIEDDLFSELEALDASTLCALDAHNIAEAMRIRNAVDHCDRFAESAMAKVQAGDEVSEHTYLAMLNMQGHIKTKRGLHDEALVLYSTVLDRSLEIMDNRDVNLWVNASNVLCQIEDFGRIEDYADRIFQGWDGTLEGRALSKAANIMNALGVHYQKHGRMAEGREFHLAAVAAHKASSAEDNAPRTTETRGHGNAAATRAVLAYEDIPLYNVCMSYLREDNMEAAIEFRSMHVDAVARAEACHGTLEQRHEVLEEDSSVYQTARKLLGSRPGGQLDAVWLEQHKEVLSRAIALYGILEPDFISVGSEETEAFSSHAHVVPRRREQTQESLKTVLARPFDKLRAALGKSQKSKAPKDRIEK